MSKFLDENTEIESIPDENDLNYRYQTEGSNQNNGDQLFGAQEGGPTATLQLEELERVFEMFHNKPIGLSPTNFAMIGQCIRDCQINDGPTVIPRMTPNSVFFHCYKDEIFDTILDDLKEHYQ